MAKKKTQEEKLAASRKANQEAMASQGGKSSIIGARGTSYEKKQEPTTYEMGLGARKIFDSMKSGISGYDASKDSFRLPEYKPQAFVPSYNPVEAQARQMLLAQMQQRSDAARDLYSRSASATEGSKARGHQASIGMYGAIDGTAKQDRYNGAPTPLEAQKQRQGMEALTRQLEQRAKYEAMPEEQRALLDDYSTGKSFLATLLTGNSLGVNAVEKADIKMRLKRQYGMSDSDIESMAGYALGVKSQGDSAKAADNKIMAEEVGDRYDDLTATLRGIAQADGGSGQETPKMVSYLMSELGVSEERANQLIENWDNIGNTKDQMVTAEAKASGDRQLDSLPYDVYQKLMAVAEFATEGATERNYAQVEEYNRFVEDLKAYVGDEGRLNELLFYAKARHNARITEDMKSKVQQDIANSGANAWLYNTMDVLASPAALAGPVDVAVQKLSGNPYVDANTAGLRYGHFSNAVQQASAARETTELGRQAYGIASSTAKSFYNMLLAGAAGEAIGGALTEGLGLTGKAADIANKIAVNAVGLPTFSASAFNSTFIEDLEKGIGEENAMKHAMATGLFEGLFEVVSMDKIYDIYKKKGMGAYRGAVEQAVRDWVIGAGIEGSEEAFTDLADWMADYIINGDYSEYSQMVAEYGREYANQYFAKQLGQDAAAGAISGFIMGGGAFGLGQLQYHNTSDAVVKANMGQDLVEVGLSMPEDTNSHRIAASMEGKEASAGQISNLLQNIVEEGSDSQALQSKLAELGQSAEVAEENAEKIIEVAEQIASGRAVSEKQSKKITSDAATSEAFADYLTGNMHEQLYGRRALDVAEKAKGEVRAAKSIAAQTKKLQDSFERDDSLVGKTGAARATYKGQEAVVTGFGKVGDSLGLKIGDDVVAKMEDVEIHDAKYRELYSQLLGLKDDKLANMLLENYNGQALTDGDYVRAGRHFYDIGRSSFDIGSDFDTAVSGSAAYAAAINNSSLVRSLYYLGQNSAQAAAEQREVKAPKRVATNGVATFDAAAEEALNDNEKDFLRAASKALKQDIRVKGDITDKSNKTIEKVNATFQEGVGITLGLDSRSQYGSLIHEVLESVKAQNEEKYNEIVRTAFKYIEERFGDKEIVEWLQAYQEAYAKVEGWSDIERVRDEFINDAIAGMFMKKEGINEFAHWVYDNNPKDEAKSLLENIADFFKRIADAIKSMIGDHKGAYDKGFRLAEKQAREIRGMVLEALNDINAMQEEDASLIADVRNSIDVDNADVRQAPVYNYSRTLAFEGTDEEIAEAEAKEKEVEDFFKDLINEEGFFAIEYDKSGFNGYKFHRILTRSARQGVEYQLTYMQQDYTPTYHENLNSPEEAAKLMTREFLFEKDRSVKLYKDTDVSFSVDVVRSVYPYVVNEDGSVRLTNPDEITDAEWQKMFNAWKKLGYGFMSLKSMQDYYFSMVDPEITKTGKAGVLLNDDQSKEIRKIFEGKADEKKEPVKDASYYAAKAEKKFGTTYSFSLAGYLDVNGKLLDFSEGQRYRVQDHREISEVLDLPEDAGYSDGLIEFMNQGNVRLQTYGVDISRMPNDKQIPLLKRFFSQIRDDIYIDYSSDSGYNITSVAYRQGTNPNEIIGEMKSYFDDGKMPEGNISYSIDVDSEGKTLSDAAKAFYADEDPLLLTADRALKRYYHGTARKDRVGSVFRPDRATSGPMAFFTSDRTIAEHYAKDKADTSTAYEDKYQDYFTQFTIESHGREVPISKAFLSPADSRRIAERASHIGFDDDYEEIIYDEENISNGLGNWDYTLRDNHGNVLRALTEAWLETGELLNQEERFLEVLRLAGYDKEVTYHNPDYRDEGVYEVYIHATKVLDTSNIPQEVIDALDAAALVAKYNPMDTASADMWDKRNVSPAEFMERFHNDIENGTTYCWTSIPDFVTDTLKSLGYDAISDTGGKYHADSHQVVIPFESNQVKDINNENPTENPDIRYQVDVGEFSPSFHHDSKGNVVIETSKYSKTQASKKYVDIKQEIKDSLHSLIGQKVVIKSDGRLVIIGTDLGGEYTGSNDTYSLNASEQYVKSNLPDYLLEVIETAHDPWYETDENGKHGNKAKRGWTKYTIDIGYETSSGTKYITARVDVRMDADGNDYLYDVIFNGKKIKSETRIKSNLSVDVLPTSDSSISSLSEMSTSVGYHAGDLGKAEPFFNMSGSRGTGHFGTGTYFVGDEAAINIGNYADRPHEKVDFGKYHLFAPKNLSDARALHEFLKGVNSFYNVEEDEYRTEAAWDAARDALDEAAFNGDMPDEIMYESAVRLVGAYEVARKIQRLAEGDYGLDYEGTLYDGDRELSKDEMIALVDMDEVVWEILHDNRYAPNSVSGIEYFDKSFEKMASILGVSAEELKDVFDTISQDIADDNLSYEEKQTADSPSTRLMKALGYEGIDVRAIPEMDNTTYGSVIYDLKGEDLERKQEIGTARFSVDVGDLMSMDDIPDTDDWAAIMDADDKDSAVSIIKQGQEMIKDVELNETQIKKLARTILKKYSSEYKAAELENNLKSLFAYMKSTQDESYETIIQIMGEIAKPIIEQSSRIDETNKEAFESVKGVMKGMKISLTAEQKKEVAYLYGSYQRFRQLMFGNGITISENGANLDSIWNELVDASGYMLDATASDVNQPEALLDLMETIKPQRINEFEMDIDRAAYDVALDIYREYLMIKANEDAAAGVSDLADRLVKKQQEYRKKCAEQYKQKLAEQTAKIKAEKELAIKKLEETIAALDAQDAEAVAMSDELTHALIKVEREKAQKRIAQVRKQNDKRVANIKAKQENSLARRAERKRETELRQKIKNATLRLQKMVTSPNVNDHVTTSLVIPTIDVLNAINIDTGRSKDIQARLEKLRVAYDAYKADKTFTSFDYDEMTSTMIAMLEQTFKGRNYTQLNADELQKVLDVVKALTTQIRNANKLLQYKAAKETIEAAKMIVGEVEASKGTTSKAISKAVDKYTTMMLDARREFRKLSGFIDDGGMMALYDELDAGQMRMLDVQRHANEIFADVLEGKENQEQVKRLLSTKPEDLVDIGLVDEDGNPVMVTRDMRLSLIMHSMNEGNMGHVLGGGFTIPDITEYGKDNFVKAYEGSRVVRYVPYAVQVAAANGNLALRDIEEEKARKRIQQIQSELSDWEKEYLKRAMQFFHEYTGSLINEVTRDTRGYAVARVKNYFPINTDKTFTKTDFAGMIQDISPEGWGALKSRVNGRNPIMLEGITNVILRETRKVSTYYGYAIPIRDMNMIMKSSFYNKGQITSPEAAIIHKWGQKDADYIKNLMLDIQNGRHRNTTTDDFFNKLRGNFAGATLTANLGVAMKQAASFPTAAAVLGWGPVAKATTDLGNGFLGKGLPELEKRNPLFWYRGAGNSTQEIAYAKKSELYKKLPSGVKKVSVDLIQNVDLATTRTLEYAAMYYVDENFKDLAKGSDEYWDKVSEIYTKVIEQTQPNYTTLNRAEILRNPNQLLKQLVLFKTQPFQNFGIVYDAWMEYVTKKSKYKQGSVEIKEAQKKLANAISSQVVAAFVFSAMTILSNLVYHKWWKYDRDKDKSMAEEMLGELLLGVLSSMSGMVFMGDTIYQAVMGLFFGGTWYGLEVSSLETINDLYDALANLAKYSVEWVDGETTESRKKAGYRTMKAIDDILVNVLKVYGVPLQNIQKTIESLYLYGVDAANAASGKDVPLTENEFPSYRNVPTQYEMMIEALTEGDKAEYKKLYDEKVATSDAQDPEESVSNAVGKAIQKAYDEGKITADDAYKAYDEIDSTKFNRVGIAVSNYLDGKARRDAIFAQIDALLADGAEASKVKSAITSNYKAMYLELKSQGKAADLQNLLVSMYMYLGDSKEKAMKKVNSWN